MPPHIPITGPCEVCSQPAHGNHFGVLSCRACAAFFRRAGKRSAKSQGLICQKGNCKVSDDGIFRCKICRLKKCFQVGMDSNKFKVNCDLISNSIKPQSLANFLGRPEIIIFCEPDKASHVKTILDVSDLIREANRIFAKKPTEYCSPLNLDNSLEKLAFSMELMKIEKAKKKNLEVVEHLGKSDALYFWKHGFVTVAQFFAALPEFQELNADVKLQILKSTWMIWLRLENLAKTADYQRNQVLGKNVFVWAEGRAMNIENVEVDFKWCSNYRFEQLKQLLNPDMEKSYKLSVEALITLDPTNVELNFMLIQLCLNHAQKKFPGETRHAIEKLLQIQSDNLHNYYVKTMRTPNYFWRLTKMMKIIQFIEADVRSQREKVHIAKVFDVFSIDFSHPEMFEII